MNRADIIREVASKLAHKTDAELAVRTAFDAIADALRSGDKVVISNFGTFRVKARKSRAARNPKTGHQVAVPPRKGVRFKASKQLLSI